MSSIDIEKIIEILADEYYKLYSHELVYNSFIDTCIIDERCIHIVDSYFENIEKYKPIIYKYNNFYHSPQNFFEIACKAKLLIVFHSIRIQYFIPSYRL
jgi:hypothetical protein